MGRQDSAFIASEDLPIFEIELWRRRSRWNWLVSTHDGRPMMHGKEATRAEASYLANRALFLLLSTANLKIGSMHQTSGGKL